MDLCHGIALIILIWSGRATDVCFDRFASPLFGHHHGVHRHIAEALHEPAGPAYFDEQNLVLGSQSEMNTHITVGNVTRTTAYLTCLLPRRCSHRNMSPYAAAVRACPDRPDVNPMVRVLLLIHK